MASEIVIYQTSNGDAKIDVRLENENVWLTQNQIATLYQTTKQNISSHLKTIFNSGELDEKSTVKSFLTVQSEGSRDNIQRPLKYYNLDAIISVGYKVKSPIGTQFRIWATNRLREYITKGFSIDDEKLKGNIDYFNELLERIRDIRTSEKVFYQKVRDIYSTSVDYDPNSIVTQNFFSIVQNKLIWAISGKTAAELVHKRTDAKKPNMGLTNWANQKQGGVIRKTDVGVSKNYLNEDELKALNLLVEQYLAFAEAQAQQRKPMYMKDWIKKLNDILTINEREILKHSGKISHKMALKKSGEQYEIFKNDLKEKERADSISELERDIKLINKKGGS